MDQKKANYGDPLHFVAVVEPGDLERKCTLLLESIRAFGGALAGAPCWFVQPRKGGRLARRTHEIFYDLDGRLLAADLNRDWPHYPIANKIFASAFVERLLPHDETLLCFLDSDVVCLREPRDLVLDPQADVGVGPVDRVGRGQQHGAPLNEYWQRVHALCGVEPRQVWTVRTNVEQAEIHAYFNAGLIVGRRRARLYNRWLDALEVARKDEPFRGKQLHNLDQALLAGIVMGQFDRKRVALLNRRYNYPLHLQHELPAENRLPDTDAIVVAHYHGLFYKRACLQELPFAEQHRSWFESRLPIETVWQRQVRRGKRHQSRRASHAAGAKT